MNAFKIKVNSYIVLLYRLSLVLFLFSFSRILLYFFNLDYFTDLAFIDLFKIYLFGLRFDLSALMMINLPFIIISLWPSDFKKKETVYNLILYISLIINSLAILANIIDIVYFRFTLKRSTYDIFSFIGANVGLFDLFKALLIDYWYMLVIYLAIIFALVSATFRIRKHAVHKKQKTSALIYRSILLIIILGIGIIGLRGGLQLKPINLIDAGKMVTYKQIPLLLNTPFSIIVTQGKQSLEIKTWQSQEEADAFFNPIHNYHKQENTFNKKNVILIILESFSADKVGYFNPSAKSLTPNLDSILNHSLTYKGLANGKKSIEGVPAILSSIPSLMQQPFLISSYASNHFSSLASILKEEDYSSAFFHGGKNGTMNLDSYALQAGFESYFGMDEYPNKEDYDGSWGIWDHSFYPFFKSKIGLLKEPFIASFFSLSSHHPYAIPEEYQDLFSHLEPIDASIAYADFALAQFFSSVRKEAWFMNTLFVITADHTAQNSSTIDSTGMIYFEIPIVFYSAQDSLISKIKHRKLAQQIDILPSVLDYIGYPSPFIAFGSSVFDTKAMDFTLYYMNGIYRGQYANLLFEFDGDKFSYTPSHNIINEIPLAELLPFENKLRALIQNYAYFIINNKLTIEK